MDIFFWQSQVFFFISSIGFVFLWILTAMFLIYLIRAASAFSRIMEKIENNINSLGDTTKEMLEDLKNNALFRFFLGKKKRNRKE